MHPPLTPSDLSVSGALVGSALQIGMLGGRIHQNSPDDQPPRFVGNGERAVPSERAVLSERAVRWTPSRAARFVPEGDLVVGPNPNPNAVDGDLVGDGDPSPNPNPNRFVLECDLVSDGAANFDRPGLGLGLVLGLELGLRLMIELGWGLGLGVWFGFGLGDESPTGAAPASALLLLHCAWLVTLALDELSRLQPPPPPCTRLPAPPWSTWSSGVALAVVGFARRTADFGGDAEQAAGDEDHLSNLPIEGGGRGDAVRHPRAVIEAFNAMEAW